MQKMAVFDRKTGNKEGFNKIENATLRNVGGQIAATLTARYYKGISGDGDNVILVYEKTTSTT